MKYIFSEEQFMLLLVLAGQRNLYMFRQTQELSDAAIVRAVSELYRRKQLSRTKGRLVLSESMRKLVSVMGQSGYVLKMTSTEGDFLQQLVYPGSGKGQAVVLERQELPGPPVIKVQCADREEYIRDLFDNERLPRGLAADRKEAREAEETALKELEKEYAESDILFEMERFNARQGERDNRICVFRSPVFLWIHVLGEKNGYYHMYSAEEMKELLLKEIRGEEL